MRALREQASSLLAVGVTSASGDFEAGDLVEVVDQQGTTVARGLVRLDVADVRRVLGRTSGEVADELGRPAGELINRDDLVVVDGPR